VNVLKHLSERFALSSASFLAVGDGENDICMLREAGCSVAFRPKTREVRAAAQYSTYSMSDLPLLAGTSREVTLIDPFQPVERPTDAVFSN
jgi:hydroxymethylpyrimidine pyrophosphatase-like HAD family hydrolase